MLSHFLGHSVSSIKQLSCPTFICEFEVVNDEANTQAGHKGGEKSLRINSVLLPCPLSAFYASPISCHILLW